MLRQTAMEKLEAETIDNDQYELVNLYSSIKTITPRPKHNPSRRPLLPVVTDAAIIKFHSRYPGHKLHDDFIFYLTKISSETISTSLQTRIDLENLEWSFVDMDWIQHGKHFSPSINDTEKEDCIVVGECFSGMATKVLVTDVTSPYWGHVVHDCPDYFDWPYLPMTSLEFLLDVDKYLVR